MATALLQYRVNGGALHEDSIEVAGGDVIALTAGSFAGWGTPAARWEIVAYPPGFTVPAGWSTAASSGYYYYLANSGGSGVTPPSVTLPDEATRWGKWTFRLTVNGTVVSADLSVETLSPALGLHDLAVGEGSQFGGTRQWVGDQQDNARIIDAAALASGGFVSSLAATTPIAVSAATGAVTASWSPSADVAMGSHKITGVTDPTNPQDAATKAYVDAVALGLDIHGSVLVATTANITLSGEQTIDGVSVTASKRVLVKDQGTGSQNGFYLCAAGSWTRTADLPTGASAAGAFCFVEQGTLGGDKGFVCTSNVGSDVVGTNSLVFTQFTGSGGGADVSARYVVDSTTAINANDITGRALAATLGLAGTSGTVPLSLTFLAATGSGASGSSLEVRRALTSGVGTTGTWCGVKFTLPDYGSGADIAAGTMRLEATAGLGTTIVTKLVLATSNGAGPVDMLTLAGNGAVRMHLYTAGRALFDGSGNITSTAITAAEVQTACAALGSALAVNSQKITGLAAGSGSGEAVEFGQLAGYVATTVTLTAGAGLTGGGTLAADRTFAVAAADASITVNADSIEASGAFVAKNISTTGTLTAGAAGVTNTLTGLLVERYDAIGAADTIGLVLRNNTTLVSTGEQRPPLLAWEGHGWNSSAGGSDELDELVVQPTLTAASGGPKIEFRPRYRRNGGAYAGLGGDWTTQDSGLFGLAYVVGTLIIDASGNGVRFIGDGNGGLKKNGTAVMLTSGGSNNVQIGTNGTTRLDIESTGKRTHTFDTAAYDRMQWVGTGRYRQTSNCELTTTDATVTQSTTIKITPPDASTVAYEAVVSAYEVATGHRKHWFVRGGGGRHGGTSVVDDTNDVVTKTNDVATVPWRATVVVNASPDFTVEIQGEAAKTIKWGITWFADVHTP